MLQYLRVDEEVLSGNMTVLREEVVYCIIDLSPVLIESSAVEMSVASLKDICDNFVGSPLEPSLRKVPNPTAGIAMLLKSL
jgi:hypothetical protein